MSKLLENRIVWDIEANGLLEESTKIWCISYKLLNSDIKGSFLPENICKLDLVDLFEDKVLIGHNIIGYDIPMIKKFYGLDLIDLVGPERIIDTFLWSQVLYPDRPMPKGCPTSIKNPITNKLKKIGPHGLESWGYRVGYKKIEIHDWTEFTPEIISRCEVDVDINEKVYYELLREAGLLCQ